ncbi:MAG: DciA family protein [Nostocaceae cyanobacterium]|nr:DciA family protein [Nostocaceae cyanobacterium]
MSLKSLNDILEALEAQAKWQEQPFPHVLRCWSEVVGAKIADHTRPLSIQRQILWVATKSAAWSQNLTFERQRLLRELNARLPSPLVDIRFSCAGWHRPQEVAQPPKPLNRQRHHPSYLADKLSLPPDAPLLDGDVNTTFQRWAKVTQTRSRFLPLCPQCQCPTPPGELQRWDVCAVCAAKQLGDG